MKPEILVIGSVWLDEVKARIAQEFTCHYLAQVPLAERGNWLAGIGAQVRGVLTTGSLGLDSALLDALPALEIVAVHGAGTDAVPLGLLAARGIVVTNTPDVLTDDVADFAVCLVLAALRRLPLLDRHVRSGQWEEGAPLRPARSLRGKVAGIYGFGRIGQAVAARLQAFGMEIRYFQRSAGPIPELRSSSLVALARESAVLVACTPGGAGTQHAIDAAVLEALGPDGTLVNIARGSVVDQEALTAALQQGRLGAAALDVFEDEPRVPAALRALDNVVLTPHVGSFTVEARSAMGRLAVDNLAAWFGGQPPLTPVGQA